jgi:hypothetical protein
MWFEDLMGFAEGGGEQVRANLELEGDRLRSLINDAEYGCGRLSIPSLAEFRSSAPLPDVGPVTLREVVGNVQHLHQDPTCAGALFQAASQFNLLEMVGPNVTPESGVGIYENDHTQGPACAIACGAGTILRNYFVPLGDALGQTEKRQVDCLRDVGASLGNREGALWTMENGYCLLTAEGREAIPRTLDAMDEDELDALRGELRIGLQTDVEVTLGGAGHHVTQVYGSALPVSYGGGRKQEWEGLGRLVLEASYEATLLAARANAAVSGNRSVYLTLLGGGVFGNDDVWIYDAIGRALGAVGSAGLDVAIVSYGSANPGVTDLVQAWSEAGS